MLLTWMKKAPLPNRRLLGEFTKFLRRFAASSDSWRKICRNLLAALQFFLLKCNHKLLAIQPQKEKKKKKKTAKHLDWGLLYNFSTPIAEKIGKSCAWFKDKQVCVWFLKEARNIEENNIMFRNQNFSSAPLPLHLSDIKNQD